MASTEPYGGRTLIVDSNVWIKLQRAPAASQAEFGEAKRRGQLRGSQVVQFELLRGASDCSGVKKQQAVLEQLPTVPITRAIAEAAARGLYDLACESGGSPGYHRVKWPDLLIAASAAERGFGVLHHDHDFDRICEVLEFDSVWFADPDENKW